MMIFIDQDEYIGSLSPIPGVRVLVHRPDIDPYPEDGGIDIGPGQRGDIKLSLVGIDVKLCRIIKQYIPGWYLS